VTVRCKKESLGNGRACLVVILCEHSHRPSGIDPPVRLPGRVVIMNSGILDRVVRLPIDLVGVEEIPGSVGSTRTPGGESQNGSDRLNSRFKWAGRPCWAAARVGGPRHVSAGVVAGI